MLARLPAKFLTPKTIIIATIVAIVGGVSAVSFIGYQSYAKFQDNARVELSEANASVADALDDFDEVAAALEQEIGAAQSALDSSAGKTLDEVARGELEKVISRASDRLEVARDEDQQLVTLVAETNANFAEQLLWPPDALDSAQRLSESTESISTDLVQVQRQLSTAVQAVVDAQAAWQAEQDRIAAEAAAQAAEEAARAQAERLSKPRQIPSGSTLSPTGGATAPTAPPPPATPAPVVAGFSIEAYLRQFVSPSQYIVQYVPRLCSGYYVCGRVLITNGSTPVIQLDSDPAVLEIYSTKVGNYVLVHELAHVQQFWLYEDVEGMWGGTAAVVPNPIPSGWRSDTRNWPVEFMADCATIYRLGFALNPPTYTSSCTAEQFAEAARYW
jgi:hypothetical protein